MPTTMSSLRGCGALRPVLAASRLSPSDSRFLIRLFHSQTQLSSSKPRPTLPFLFVPANNTVRRYTSQRRQWLRHELKLAVRYTLIFWGVSACCLLIYFAVNEEILERRYPTPHEWSFVTRQFLRAAHDCASQLIVSWVGVLSNSREATILLEKDAEINVISGREDPALKYPPEFLVFDISIKSEEWRRGYFEVMLLAAKAAEQLDGCVVDGKSQTVFPPEFVIGPSNPRPKPLPGHYSHAPREEDCKPAFPDADNWYVKMMATKGFSPRQRMQIALEYAVWMEHKGQREGIQFLHDVALAEASRGVNPSQLSYDPATLVLKEARRLPSLNVIDTLTAIANYKARNGQLSQALPIYLSLIKARRALPNTPPPRTASKPKIPTVFSPLIDIVSPPPYPPPPPDGTEPPWRNREEMCQEASLNLYVGEILFATSSKQDGISWTRDGIDAAEEQLRALDPQRPGAPDAAAIKTCRECLSTGLDNWATMVARMAREEREKKASGEAAKASSVLSFWSGAQTSDSRWEAEQAVVRDRVERAQELLMDIQPEKPTIASMFKI